MNQKLAYVWVALTLSLLICAPAQAGRLSDAKSPYLLSHAEDAIDWHAWRIETLDLARRENKLIFLSIGYASCHWCHVMSRTTFSDPSVIKVLNENYINILVDREERPDLDSYFMKIMSAMIGTSGLPANFFLTPDLVPVFAGGYLAPKSKYGDPGFLKVSMSIAREWSNNRQNFAKDVDITRAQLKAMWQPPSGRGPEKGGDFRKRAQRHWSQRFDRKYGGFGNQPKFPQPNVLLFLLAQAAKGGAPNLLDNIYRTLDHMAAGGIRDQLGGAFHRYAVDRFWQVPHFEIMLNQNALLAQVYLAAFQLSGKPLYAAIARGILDDLILRFRLSRGGFAASLDAESEGGDGQYYTWTRDEVRAVLGVRESALFINSYVDTVHGLIRGRSVLRHLGATDTQLKSAQRLSASRTRLLKARQKRVPPSRDDKVLISWNALVVSALAKAARILDEQRYLAIAQDEM
ncbi:MAG: thioredoxin domain-containing protein, partial [Rhodospirillales bacterium]|nr:thioredoxin domain-containing protein [Rhodospirillales bacterium]